MTILEEDEELQENTVDYLSYEKTLEAIAQNPFEEITRLQEETRLSLAGGQEKIALYHQPESSLTEGWYIPLLGSPSTHILKPGVLEDRYPNLTLNEFLCMRASKHCNIPTASVDILYPESPLLIVERFDRFWALEQTKAAFSEVRRLHQEDCCQACGIDSEMKYEQDGGPGFKRIRNLLSAHAKQPLSDIMDFVRLGLFNYLIGNCDAHAKNYSLLHTERGTVILAPAYDLISTAIYDGTYGARLNRSMAMRVGGHAHIDKITSADFKQFAQDVRVQPSMLAGLSNELVEGMELGFKAACEAAHEAGFSFAEELASKILASAEKRAETLKNV